MLKLFCFLLAYFNSFFNNYLFFKFQKPGVWWKRALPYQGSPNSVKGWEWDILQGDFFYWVVRTWGGVILIIQTFFKAKNNIL